MCDGVMTRSGAYFAAAQYVQTLARFEEIRTDRLHAALAATLLGKNVTLFDNNYFKCRAVYEASLRQFPNIIMANND